MAVYVDPLMSHGWVMRNKTVPSCHMFADTLDELHEMALKIGMKREWFQENPKLNHYDLVKSRRELAVRYGAIELDMMQSVMKWRELRDAVQNSPTS